MTSVASQWVTDAVISPKLLSANAGGLIVLEEVYLHSGVALKFFRKFLL